MLNVHSYIVHFNEFSGVLLHSDTYFNALVIVLQTATTRPHQCPTMSTQAVYRTLASPVS